MQSGIPFLSGFIVVYLHEMRVGGAKFVPETVGKQAAVERGSFSARQRSCGGAVFSAIYKQRAIRTLALIFFVDPTLIRLIYSDRIILGKQTPLI